jgi:fluoride ion exporter CrcB/FEX
MPRTAVIIGTLLILLGVVSFLLSGFQSWTALIPTGFGLILAALGFVAQQEKSRRDAMHAAAGVGVIGLLGTVGGFVKLFRLLKGDEGLRPGAVVGQSIMFVLCTIFVGLAVNSFIEARRNRER